MRNARLVSLGLALFAPAAPARSPKAYIKREYLDPELARALTEMDRRELDKYNDLFIVGRSTDDGFELRVDATYRE